MSWTDERMEDQTLAQNEGMSRLLWSGRASYAWDVKWLAPARGIEINGREVVLAHLRREASGMREPEFTSLRCSAGERLLLDEFAVRFFYSGAGLCRAPIEPGDFVELYRLRILELTDGRITTETCIENWTVLPPPGDRRRAPESAAPPCPKGHGS